MLVYSFQSFTCSESTVYITRLLHDVITFLFNSLQL
jgi:hypothetical protein